jgi:hypothetical protein
MLIVANNLLKNIELNNLLELCFDNELLQKVDKDKIPDNNYNRLYVENSRLKSYYDNLNEFLNKNISETKINILDLSKPNSWINVVTTDTNKDDGFHYDNASLSVVTYLNDNFESGEFEYVDSKNKKPIKIKPKLNKTLIMDETLHHRVLPIKNGIRFSLVTFYQFVIKKEKTLI